jgi:peptide/nickel transport system permease protein
MAGARIVRAQVRTLRSRAHLRAAVGFGAGTFYIVRRHLVPELAPILIAGFVVAAERAVVLEAGLAFLGLGDPSRKSWGSIMHDALGFSSLFLTDAWRWWLLPPIVALGIFVLGLTFLGMALEERVNPRLRRHAGGAA